MQITCHTFHTLHRTGSTPMALQNNSVPTAQMMLGCGYLFLQYGGSVSCAHCFQQVSHAATYNHREELGNSCFGLSDDRPTFFHHKY